MKGIGYRLYNELKAQIEIKKREQHKATEDLLKDKLTPIEYQIKTYMERAQIDLLNELAEKEFGRLERLKKKEKDDEKFNRWAIMTHGKEGLIEIGNLGWFTGDCEEEYILNYCKEKGIKITKNEVYEELVRIVENE